MQINVTVDPTQLQTWTHLAEKKLAYAAVNALNATAKRVQQAVFEHVRSTFEVRTPFLIDRKAAATIGRTDFASVKRAQPWVEIHVWQAKRFLLPYFEQGAERQPIKGKKRVAMPFPGSAARPTWSSPVPKALQVGALKLKRMTRSPAPGRKRRRRAQGTRIWQGLQRTYEIPNVGIYQRVGHHDPHLKRDRGSVLIYPFLTGQQIRPQLEFVKTAETVGEPFFREEMTRQLEDALGHEAARGRL